MAHEQLLPDVRRIDQEGFYPEGFLRAFGAAGGFAAHAREEAGIATSLALTTEIGTLCASSAFLLWCQNSCIWYLVQTENEALRERWLSSLVHAELLAGTAFSNPIKHDAGLEALRLSGVRENGGYRVSGVLPWVSNLELGHLFGIIFATREGPVAALARVDGERVRIGPSGRFSALEGTATHSVRFHDAWIADHDLLAPNATVFLEKVRPGFLLLQLGIGFGIIRGALRDMEKVERRLGNLNRYVSDGPDTLRPELEALEEKAALLACAHAASRTGLRAVLETRLATAELVGRATAAGLQHAGAPGFLIDSAPQRRLREGAFFALLTPSMKHLRSLLARI